MKKFVKYLAAVLITTVILFAIIVLSILKFPSGVFYDSYPNLISDKYKMLKKINEPKIVVVAGSSGAFGLDQRLLEKETGYKVVNMGLHAGFGFKVLTQWSKANINEGDIILLAYEWCWIDEFYNMDPELVMTGIDDNIEMYRWLPKEKWGDIIGYLFRFAQEKNGFTAGGGNYSRQAFDPQDFQMISERPEPFSQDGFELIDVTGVELPDDIRDYIIDYKKYAQDRGARVYFAAPPVLEDAVVCDYSEFDKFTSMLEEKTGIEFISNPSDYFFPKDYMYDTTYHCNTRGERARTQQLAKDLKESVLSGN